MRVKTKLGDEMMNGEDGEVKGLIKSVKVGEITSEMRSLAKINGEMIEMQRNRIAEMEQALRAEIDHSKQLVADCRSCKKVQELEKSIQWYVDFANAQDKSLTNEIQRANLAESLVEHLQSEVDALKNDLSIAKEANKRYRAQLSQRNGLLTADKAIK